MKNIFVWSLLFLSFTVTAQQPNIIVFLVDDMGWQDTSVPFDTKASPLNKRYRTPNMEKLAFAGMTFTNAYAAPVCTPSRTALMTGMNPAHSHITNWTSTNKNDNTDFPDDELAPADWNYNGFSPVAGIPHTQFGTPLPALLKQAGYFTIHVGKAHWGAAGTPGANPYNMGFMVNIAGHAAGHPQSYLAQENFGNLPGKASMQAVPDLEEYYGTDSFLTEALTLEAIKSMEAPVAAHQPFFLHMAHYAVHTPIMADARFVQKYLDSGLDSIEANYASLIEGMDKSLGDILDFVRQKGLEKNTVILFMSDNGGLSLVPPRGGPAHTQNLPLKAGKGSVYEGGIRVPMLVKWPGKVKAGSRTNQYTMIEDFFPTILDIAGIKNSVIQQTVDGKTILPMLHNPGYADNNRVLIWHYPNKWQGIGGPGINYYSAIRKGQWKMVYNQRTGRKALYNLVNDIGELNDLAAVEPRQVKELASLLSKQLREWYSPMPVTKSTGKALPWPDE